MTQILILGLGAILSLYGVYLCVKGMMWTYFKFLESESNLESAWSELKSCFLEVLPSKKKVKDE